jgi:hypothetical protein
MKRLLGIALALVSLGFVASSEAKAAERSHANSTVAANAIPQWQRNGSGRHNRRGACGNEITCGALWAACLPRDLSGKVFAERTGEHALNWPR